MEDCAPSTFLGSWVLVALYLCSKFRILDKLVLEVYVFQVEGGSHLLQSCFHATQNNLPLATRELHLFFESLAVIGTPGLQAFQMDIHHDTSFKSILEDDSISSTFRAWIHFCSSKVVGLWLITMPFIYLFRIAHVTFISVMRFHLGLIQPLASNLFMCECGHGLDTFNMHLTHCPFSG